MAKFRTYAERRDHELRQKYAERHRRKKMRKVGLNPNRLGDYLRWYYCDDQMRAELKDAVSRRFLYGDAADGPSRTPTGILK